MQHEYKYKLHNYVDPFFSQAWTLFAPNPINTNMSLLMKFNYQTKEGTTQIIDWIDITEPLIRERKEYFWSPAQRISKFTQSCMSNINENHKIILEQIVKTDSLAKDTVKAKLFYKKSLMATYGHNSLLQYSKYIARNYFSKNNIQPKKIEVKYRILNAKFPRFSKRKEDYYNLDNYEFNEITSDYYLIKNIFYNNDE
ncbi:MAG: DUF5819 family protein [Capnocytophaga sp.]|nr:DUF5819 family protein [Capnocytophaga sp.]